jgi:uncharacterized protein (TIGR03000 family)
MPRFFSLGKFTALAVVGALSMPAPSFAQQGQRLFEWSGHWPNTSAYGIYRESPAAQASMIASPTPYAGQEVYQSFYPAVDVVGRSFYPGTFDRDRPALLNINMPANAEISFNDIKARPGGPMRQFVSPPLTPGYDYSYDVKATWTDQGKTVTRIWHVVLHAGDVINVSFRQQ